jgi:endonuclease/exonuclease/phosphatase family metal-dependent hydrolase
MTHQRLGPSETTVPRLPPVSPEKRRAFLEFPKTPAAHREAMSLTEAMHVVELGGQPHTDALPARFRVAAWNLERCIDPPGSARLLAEQAPDVVLLSEMDNGMARSGQRHTTRDLAGALNMTYAYGVEFLELGLGNSVEVRLAALDPDAENVEGFHGNGILSRAPITRACLIRLDDHGHWFDGNPVGDERGQPRVGGRMAIAVEVPTLTGPVVLVSTHLESNADIAHRDAQMGHILSEVALFAGTKPVLIGGDLNTGNHLPSGDWREETLFDMARSHGYHWDGTPEGNSTRPSRISLVGWRAMKLDWFCAQGLTAHTHHMVPALDAQGVALSDHDMILADWTLAEGA